MTELHEREAVLAEPTWEFARLFPAQGQWDEEDYALRCLPSRKRLCHQVTVFMVNSAPANRPPPVCSLSLP